MHYGVQPVTQTVPRFLLFGTHAGASDGTAAAAAGPATGEGKTYLRVYYWTSGGVMMRPPYYFYGLSSPVSYTHLTLPTKA